MQKKIVLLAFIFYIFIIQGCTYTKLSNTEKKPSTNTNQISPIEKNQNTSPSQVSSNPISTSKKIAAISAGTDFSLALTQEGELYAWGNNTFGSLGINNVEESLVPVKIVIDEKIKQISAGPRGMILTENGIVYAWGKNTYGEVGDGTNEERLIPVKVKIPEKVSKIVKGNVGIAITENGNLYMWGWNLQGEVGNGTTEHISTPSEVKLPQKVIDVSGFGTHILALCENGALYAWGSNYFGELGDRKPIANENIKNGDLIENNALTPQLVKFDKKIRSLAAGNRASYVLCDDGSVYAWGANDVGQLGVGNNIKYTSTPIKVSINEKIKFITSGQFHALALSQSGNLYCWGYNSGDIGVVGNGSMDKIVYLPQKIKIDGAIDSISAGGGHTFVLTKYGKIYGWGANAFGQLGTCSTNNNQKPTLLNIQIK